MADRKVTIHINGKETVTPAAASAGKALSRLDQQAKGFGRGVRTALGGFGLLRLGGDFKRLMDSFDDTAKRLGENGVLGAQAKAAADDWTRLKNVWQESADVLKARLAPALSGIMKDLSGTMRDPFIDAMQQRGMAGAMAGGDIRKQIEAQTQRRDSAERARASAQKMLGEEQGVWKGALALWQRTIGGDTNLEQLSRAVDMNIQDRNEAQAQIDMLTKLLRGQVGSDIAAKLAPKGGFAAIGNGILGAIGAAAKGGKALDDLNKKAFLDRLKADFGFFPAGPKERKFDLNIPEREFQKPGLGATDARFLTRGRGVKSDKEAEQRRVEELLREQLRQQGADNQQIIRALQDLRREAAKKGEPLF